MEFSSSTSRVTAWISTDGAFNALGRNISDPASGAANTELFRRGSSRDLVARLQGEPQSKNSIDILGEEDWRYPGGTVKFDSTTGQVIYWENRDGSLKVRGIRPAINNFDFNQGRRSRLAAWRRKGKQDTNRKTILGCTGCLGIVVVVIITSCGDVSIRPRLVGNHQHRHALLILAFPSTFQAFGSTGEVKLSDVKHRFQADTVIEVAGNRREDLLLVNHLVVVRVVPAAQAPQDLGSFDYHRILRHSCRNGNLEPILTPTPVILAAAGIQSPDYVPRLLCQLRRAGWTGRRPPGTFLQTRTRLDGEKGSGFPLRRE